MRLLPSLLALLACLTAAPPALAWSPEGHQIVAAIAARELTPMAREKISALLGGDAAALMVLDSSWADEIRDLRPETSAWHFVNIPIGSRGYDARRDCPTGECIVAQIERQGHILADPRAPKAARTGALRFLIHLVADLHQPLHAADRHDRGGNDVLIRSPRTNMHQLWDQGVVGVMGNDSERIARDIEARLTPAQRMQMRTGTPTDWANESFALATREIYAKIPRAGRASLPLDYARAESGVARLQLTKAGLRLAAMLNRLLAR